METDCNHCVCCNIMIPPAAPDRCCRKIGGRLVVAHRGCLRGLRLKEAVSLVCDHAERFGGAKTGECRNVISRAKSFDGHVMAMRTVLRLIYHDGLEPDAVRKRRVRQMADRLEEMLLQDFTDCLETPK